MEMPKTGDVLFLEHQKSMHLGATPNVSPVVGFGGLFFSGISSAWASSRAPILRYIE